MTAILAVEKMISDHWQHSSIIQYNYDHSTLILGSRCWCFITLYIVSMIYQTRVLKLNFIPKSFWLVSEDYTSQSNRLTHAGSYLL